MHTNKLKPNEPELITYESRLVSNQKKDLSRNHEKRSRYYEIIIS